MGRQVNFYMTREDEEKFLRHVRSSGDVAVLPYASPTQDFKPLLDLSDSPIQKFSGTYWLFNRSVSNNLVVTFVSAQGYYTVDDDRSSVVQFIRSSLRNGSIHRGRIWAEFKYLDRDKMALLPKEGEFREWYYTIAKWIRRNYKLLERLTYAGPGALKRIEEGFSLK